MTRCAPHGRTTQSLPCAKGGGIVCTGFLPCHSEPVTDVTWRTFPPRLRRGKFKSWPTATPLLPGGRGDAGRGRVPSEARLRAVGRDAATTGGHTATRRPAVLTAAPPTERRATNNVRDAADTFPPSLILVGGGESKGASPASDRAGAPRRHAAGTPEIK